MYLLPTRILWLSSLLVVLAGCATPPYLHLPDNPGARECVEKFNPKFSVEMFHASINITGKHLSGLLIFKTMHDSSTRVVFSSESGITFFDFEYAGPGFRVISIISKLNKQVVINQLKKDIGLLIRHNKQGPANITKTGDNELYHGYRSKKEITWYITDKDCTSLNRIETASKRKKKIIVNLTGYGEGLADSVYIDHQAFEFNISLKKIER